MRSIQTFGLSCIAAVSCAAAAQNTGQPAPHQATARAAVDGSVSTSWPGRTRHDRLSYLDGSRCVERRGCTTSSGGSRSPAAPREYIDSLNLGTYGPMKFKFTGDRVKLKVRF